VGEEKEARMTEDAKPMSGSVTKTLELPASAGEVWAVVGDFNGLPRWNAGVERSDLSEGGRRRTLTLKTGVKVVEDLVHHDDGGRSLSYSIVEGPVPVSRHKATLSVSDRGPNQSTVHWRCEFDPKEVPVEVVTGIFSGVFDRGLKQLADLFGEKGRS
jgi:uncharacterized protein YndB with AHSA1/START domain